GRAAARAAARLHLLPQRADLLRPHGAAGRGAAARGAARARRLSVHVALREPERAEARTHVGGAGRVPAGAVMRSAAESFAPELTGARRLVIGIGEFAVSNRPGDVIVTHALGSCIAVCIFDPRAGVAGMLHFMLPEASIN